MFIIFSVDEVYLTIAEVRILWGNSLAHLYKERQRENPLLLCLDQMEKSKNHLNHADQQWFVKQEVLYLSDQYSRFLRTTKRDQTWVD